MDYRTWGKIEKQQVLEDLWIKFAILTQLCSLKHLRPCCPAQALLHTSRTIFSACPLFLLGLWGGVVGSCICVAILLLSVPYFKLFWLRLACGLPETYTEKVQVGGEKTHVLPCEVFPKINPTCYFTFPKMKHFACFCQPTTLRQRVSKQDVVPHRLERICSGLNSSGVSKAKMESLSWMISRSSSSSQKERWKPS